MFYGSLWESFFFINIFRYFKKFENFFFLVIFNIYFYSKKNKIFHINSFYYFISYKNNIRIIIYKNIYNINLLHINLFIQLILNIFLI